MNIVSVRREKSRHKSPSKATRNKRANLGFLAKFPAVSLHIISIARAKNTGRKNYYLDRLTVMYEYDAVRYGFLSL